MPWGQIRKNQRNNLTSRLRLFVRENGTSITPLTYHNGHPALLVNMNADEMPDGFVERMVAAVQAAILNAQDGT